MRKYFEGTCIDYTFDGQGICKTEEGLPVFVNGMIRGEVGLISYIDNGKSFCNGKIERFTHLSPHRVIPKCPIYSLCGGCNLMHMTYEEQCALKQNYVKDVLKKIGGLDCEVQPIIRNDVPYRYRNKVQVSFRRDFKGEIIAGFYAEKTHQIINRDICLLENDIADQIVIFFKDLMQKLHLEPYDDSSSRPYGSIKHILVRTSSLKEVMVVIVTADNRLNRSKDIVTKLTKAFPSIKSIVHNINPSRGSQILGKEEYVLFGNGYINDVLCGLHFKISPKSFYQINHDQTERLYNTAIKLAKLTGKENVLDAYCGIGTIGLCASKKANSVVGVEIIEDAIKNAKENAKDNHITNSSFNAEDASKFLVREAKEGKHYDVVFVDPPRGGCDEKFITSLIQVKPSKIVYISCNPATLARDLKTLKEHYDVLNVQPVDLFSQTYHVETIVLLEAKQTKK